MIYIVRHGQTEWNKNGIIQGHSDVPLNEQGIKDAKVIKEKLKDVNFDIVFSSPLKRAYQTAQIITSNEIKVDERLIERYNGVYDGKHKDEIFKSINFSNDEECSKYNIELEKDIKHRLTDFLTTIKQEVSNKDILIVAHAGVILNIRIIIEGMPKSGNIKEFKLKNCEYIVYNNEIDCIKN